MTEKDLKNFCVDFAYQFMSSECMEEELRPLTCGQAQIVKDHLYSHLFLDLQAWLEGEQKISIE